MLQAKAHWRLRGSAFDLWHRTQLYLLKLGHRQGTLHSGLLSLQLVGGVRSIRNTKHGIWSAQYGKSNYECTEATCSFRLETLRLGTGSAFHHRLTGKRDTPKHQTTAPQDHRIKARQRQPHRKPSGSRATFASNQHKDRLQSLSQSAIQPLSHPVSQSFSQLVSESGAQFGSGQLKSSHSASWPKGLPM